MKASIQSMAPAAPKATGCLIAVVPVYNEEATVVSVLDGIEPLVDEIVVVEDGSSDQSRGLILRWAEPRPHAQVILFDQNQGLSAAYYGAFNHLAERLESRELTANDAVITVDADGQHEPTDLNQLAGRLYEGPCDAVIARRDLSGYSMFKRFGNWLLSLWASLWAGCRLYDVESGFRVFRLGALAEALQYYRGYRYSETVEVAVILARLGYQISNDIVVRVPVSRSRTRLSDGVIDALAMVGAWWRVTAGRHRPAGMPAWSLYAVPPLAVAALLFISVDLLINPLFLAGDSMHSYAHVWYISEQIFDHARFPIRMELLDSGRASAFPYSFVPYLMGAVLFPVFGDWAVTLLMVAAILGVIGAAGLARPIMRDPWFILLFILNPFFIDAIYGFQFASLWATLFFFLFVWAFENERYLLSAPLAWLTVSSHPVIGAAAMATYGLWVLLFARQALRPLVLTSIPVLVALVPIYWMMMLTPAISENSVWTIGRSVADSIGARGTFIAMPFVFSALAPHLRRLYRPALVFSITAAGIGLLTLSGVWRYEHAPGGYYGAFHRSSDIYADFFRSPAFRPGATYRILEPSEREDGMYRFIRHGAVLANEFFNESEMHRSWTESQYGCYGAFNGVGFVVMESAYLKQFRVNEEQLLKSLVTQGRAHILYSDAKGRFSVYDVREFMSEQRKPHSLKECGLF